MEISHAYEVGVQQLAKLKQVSQKRRVDKDGKKSKGIDDSWDCSDCHQV
jgi:hypothetical protein